MKDKRSLLDFTQHDSRFAPTLEGRRKGDATLFCCCQRASFLGRKKGTFWFFLNFTSPRPSYATDGVRELEESSAESSTFASRGPKSFSGKAQCPLFSPTNWFLTPQESKSSKSSRVRL